MSAAAVGYDGETAGAVAEGEDLKKLGLDFCQKHLLCFWECYIYIYIYDWFDVQVYTCQCSHEEPVIGMEAFLYGGIFSRHKP